MLGLAQQREIEWMPVNIELLHFFGLRWWRQSFVLNWLRIFLHFIKACPDLPWLDQIYCSGYKLYCRRYWPDLPEMCRKWPRKGKIDRTNNFWQSAFFLRILRLPSNFSLWTLVHYRCFSERPSLEKGGSLGNLGRSFIPPSPWDLQSRKISWIRLFPSISKQIPRHLYFPQEAQKNKKERQLI